MRLIWRRPSSVPIHPRSVSPKRPGVLAPRTRVAGARLPGPLRGRGWSGRPSRVTSAHA
jgi:hypothetical protein